MPSYHLEIKSGSKGTAKNHARYIARQGKHERRKDLVHAGHGNMPSWAVDNPDLFWESADRNERANGAAYREYVLAIPNEFNASQKLEFTTRAIQCLLGNKPFQYAIHGSKASLGSSENVHTHIMFSDRIPDDIARTPEKMFSRHNPKHPERGGCKKSSGGLTRLQLRDDVIAKRKSIADLQNQMLEEGGFKDRVDSRSHRDRGIDRKPERHLGPARIKKMDEENKAAYLLARETSLNPVAGAVAEVDSVKKPD